MPKAIIGYEPAGLLDVMTVREAADMWGMSDKGIINALVMEEKRTDQFLIRKSGKVWLTTMMAMRSRFGMPKNPRPNYE